MAELWVSFLLLESSTSSESPEEIFMQLNLLKKEESIEADSPVRSRVLTPVLTRSVSSAIYDYDLPVYSVDNYIYECDDMNIEEEKCYIEDIIETNNNTDNIENVNSNDNDDRSDVIQISNVVVDIDDNNQGNSINDDIYDIINHYINADIDEGIRHNDNDNRNETDST